MSKNMFNKIIIYLNYDQYLYCLSVSGGITVRLIPSEFSLESFVDVEDYFLIKLFDLLMLLKFSFSFPSKIGLVGLELCL